MKHSKALFFFLFFAMNFSVKAGEIWSKYSKISTLNANFRQEKVLKSMGIRLSSEGSLHFKKPDFFEWTVTKPRPVKLVYKKGSFEVWENGVLKTNAGEGSMDARTIRAISHLRAWLTLDEAFIHKNYEMKKTGPENYEFTPKGSDLFFKRITVQLGKNVPLERMTLVEMSDDEIQIVFSGTRLTYEK